MTFELLGTLLPFLVRISTFEVKVASLHKGQKSDYSIIRAILNSQPDVLRSEQTLDAVCPSSLTCRCTAQALGLLSHLKKNVKLSVKPHQYDMSITLGSAATISPPTDDLGHILTHVTSFCLSSLVAGSRCLPAAEAEGQREAVGACLAHC